MFQYLSSEFATDTDPLALAVIVPTYNERENVEELIARLDLALADTPHELIFVDDGSTDGTPEMLERVALLRRDVRLIRRVGRHGLASAVIEGMLASAAPVLAVIDADLQHDEQLLPKMYAAIIEGADVAIGTRYADGGSIGSWNPTRARISRYSTLLTNRLLHIKASDPMSGFFAVRRDVLLHAAPKLSAIGYKILADLLASTQGPIRVREFPYEFRARTAGASKLDATVAAQFVMLLYDKLFGRYVPLRFAMFVCVGMVGVGVHLSALGTLLSLMNIGFVGAQTAASFTAMTANFFLNNAFTYRDRRLSGFGLLRGLLSFFLVCGVGLIANVGVGRLMFLSDHRWWLAGIAGAAIGSVWNYALSSTLTWKRQ